jgi:hypothetical protein
MRRNAPRSAAPQDITRAGSPVAAALASAAPDWHNRCRCGSSAGPDLLPWGERTSCSRAGAGTCGPRPPAGYLNPSGTRGHPRAAGPEGCTRTVATAIDATAHRPDRAPLMRFRSPTAFTGRAALSGAAGIRTIPLRRFRSVPPPNPASRPAPRWRQPRPTGPVAERVFRPCGFTPAPAACDPRPDRRWLAASHSRAPARIGSCTAGLFSGRCSATHPGHRATWPGPLFALAPAALLGFDPSRCCSRPRVSGPLGPSDPPAVLPAPRPARGVCCEPDRPAKTRHPR